MEYQNENFNGEYDFRSRIHYGWVINENLHEYSEILFCVEGYGDAVINGKTIPLTAGEMLWIPPNYVHGYHFKNATVICAVFSNDFIPLFSRATAGRFFKVSPVKVCELEEIIKLFPSLKSSDYFAISGYLHLLCDKVFKQSDFENKSQMDGVLFQKVISYLQVHYNENVTLGQIAKRFGYNEKYLSHTLHSLTGFNFRKFITFYRIRHAKHLLENKPDMTISSVSMESGFGAINSFNRSFKEITGITPFEYRARHTK